MIRSKSFRLARRAGLNTTISHFWVNAKHAAKIAILNVFPKRRGVLISTSDEHLDHPFLLIITGFCCFQSCLYRTRAVDL